MGQCNKRTSSILLSLFFTPSPSLVLNFSHCLYLFDPGAGKGDMLTRDTEGEMSTPSKSSPHESRYLSSGAKFLGVDLSPDNFAVAMVYFVQGVLGLARLAVNFYLKDDLHLDPAEVCFLNFPFSANYERDHGVYLVSSLMQNFCRKFLCDPFLKIMLCIK